MRPTPRRSDPRPLLIGQAPSRDSDPARPFSGRSGRFLERLAGLPEGGLAVAFELANLVDRWPGASPRGKGDRFPKNLARLAADRFDLRGRTVVFAGLAVARAFGFAKPPVGFAPHRGGLCVVIPHPSGVNLWWNDPTNRALAADVLRSLVRPPEVRGSASGTGGRAKRSATASTFRR